MDNKLSELSKPVQIFKHPAGRNFWQVSADSNAGRQDVEAFYSQEYVSALIQRAERLDSILTESVQALKETEQKSAELEQAMRHIHSALLDITVPRAAIAKAAELAVEYASMKEQNNG